AKFPSGQEKRAGTGYLLHFPADGYKQSDALVCKTCHFWQGSGSCATDGHFNRILVKTYPRIVAGIEKLCAIYVSRVSPKAACNKTPAVKYEKPFLLSRQTTYRNLIAFQQTSEPKQAVIVLLVIGGCNLGNWVSTTEKRLYLQATTNTYDICLYNSSCSLTLCSIGREDNIRPDISL